MKLNNNDDSHNSGLNLLIYNMLLDIESHPAWVCGLKQQQDMPFYQRIAVTPCVGVWIETVDWSKAADIRPVTPCVGVWIETCQSRCISACLAVTPCVGVWIETNRFKALCRMTVSHPAWVCGLKQRIQQTLATWV